MTVGLAILKAFTGRHDPTLQGHFKFVCNPSTGKLPDHLNVEFRKRDVFCSQIEKLARSASWDFAPVQVSCDNVRKARTSPMTGKEKVKIDFPLTRVGTIAAGPLLAAYFAGQQTAAWSEGHYVQILRYGQHAGGKDLKRLHVVLLDTTDWSSDPSYAPGCASNHNANCGVISLRQQKTVGHYLRELGENDRVILAGHYPIKKLANESANWLSGELSRAPERTVYFSAHTHDGWLERSTISGVPAPVTEVNVDSLIDWPASYWSMTMDAERGQMCFEPRNPWVVLGCADELGPLQAQIMGAARNYRDRIAPYVFDTGDKQWRLRASDAAKTIEAFARTNSLPSCEEIDFAKASPGQISTAMQQCQATLDEKILATPMLRTRAACSALVGSAAFNMQLPGKWPVREKYERFCM